MLASRARTRGPPPLGAYIYMVAPKRAGPRHTVLGVRLCPLDFLAPRARTRRPPPLGACIYMLAPKRAVPRHTVLVGWQPLLSEEHFLFPYTLVCLLMRCHLQPWGALVPFWLESKYSAVKTLCVQFSCLLVATVRFRRIPMSTLVWRLLAEF